MVNFPLLNDWNLNTETLQTIRYSGFLLSEQEEPKGKVFPAAAFDAVWRQKWRFSKYKQIVAKPGTHFVKWRQPRLLNTLQRRAAGEFAVQNKRQKQGFD